MVLFSFCATCSKEDRKTAKTVEPKRKSQDDPKAKMLLLLGEVGGLDEYDLIEAGPEV